MISIIRWTLWQRRWSTLWWSFGMALFIFISMITYPSFRDQAAELQKGFENLSQTTVNFIGGSTDFFSPVGFLNSQVFFLTLPLLLGILGISLGCSLLAREEQDYTVDLLLSKPVSRTELLFGKALSGLIILSFVAIIGLGSTVITAHIVDLDVSAANIAFAMFACTTLCASFGAIAFMITALGRARVASMAIASFVAFGGYIISSLAGTVDWLQGVSKAFPFHYYRPEQILSGTFEVKNLLFFAAIVIISGIISWAVFNRRDIA